MNALILLLLCLVSAFFGMMSVELYPFVRDIEAVNDCKDCMDRDGCAARKTIFKDSDLISEFMLVAYLLVRKKCSYADKSHLQSFVKIIISYIILVGVLIWSRGLDMTCIIYSVATIMLLSLSVVDWNTQYIPVEYTGVIFVCGLIRLFADISNWWEYVIGLIAVSGFLYIVNKVGTPVIRKIHNDNNIDSVMGDGDIKLMAATGLLIGWKLNFLALGMGCIIGSIIHLILMKIKGSDRDLAFGPYLSLGVYITMICGEQLVSWYLNMIGYNPYIQ